MTFLSCVPILMLLYDVNGELSMISLYIASRVCATFLEVHVLYLGSFFVIYRSFQQPWTTIFC